MSRNVEGLRMTTDEDGEFTFSVENPPSEPETVEAAPEPSIKGDPLADTQRWAHSLAQENASFKAEIGELKQQIQKLQENKQSPQLEFSEDDFSDPNRLAGSLETVLKERENSLIEKVAEMLVPVGRMQEATKDLDKARQVYGNVVDQYAQHIEAVRSRFPDLSIVEATGRTLALLLRANEKSAGKDGRTSNDENQKIVSQANSLPSENSPSNGGLGSSAPTSPRDAVIAGLKEEALR